MSKKIVFFFPSFASTEATAPLGILAVATPLLRAGYEVCLIDSTITPNYKKRVLEEVRDAFCLGISLVTGPMIRETVEIARAIKEWNPDFPIILGGWHPSLLPTQTLEAPYIDYVVRGQGEESLLELVQHIESRSAPDFVAGIGFKRDDKLIFTPERPLRPLVDMPPKAYHLADFDAYERLCGRRWAMYTSSLACPFNCAYCTNAGVYGRKWNALPAEQFVEETVDLSRRYDLEMLWIVDDNFLVDLDRARSYFRGTGACRRRVPVEHPGDHEPCRAPFSRRPEAAAPQRAAPDMPGRRIGFAKSLGSHEQGLSGFRSIYESAARCLAAGIRPSFNIIFAFPGEGAEGATRDHQFHHGRVPAISRRRVLDQYLHPLSRRSHHGRACGTWRSRCPTRFEGWADFFPRYTKLPWLNGRDHQPTAGNARLPAHCLRSHSHRGGHGANRITRLAQKCISLPARWRLDHGALPFSRRTLAQRQTEAANCGGVKAAVDAKRLEPNPNEATC